MAHLWLRAEQRDNEKRTGLTPRGVKTLLDRGFEVTVERSETRVIRDQDYQATGCDMAPSFSWPKAPSDAIILGLKELPEDGTPLHHRHIMFGHAYKGQPSGLVLLQRFKDGGGTLLDLEYLTDEDGRRVAAFGYWAGYAGAAVALKCWIAQQHANLAGPVQSYESSTHLLQDLQTDLMGIGTHRPTALIIGAKGRVGSGAADLCKSMGVATTLWDIEETARGAPFPEVLAHDLFFNCILARPGTPIFVPKQTSTLGRKLSVIGDIACDPDSDFSPIRVYNRTTTWDEPALRVHDAPPLDVTAIDNLPSMLPRESSEDFAEQLLPTLVSLKAPQSTVWTRATEIFEAHAKRLDGS